MCYVRLVNFDVVNVVIFMFVQFLVEICVHKEKWIQNGT